MPDSPEWFARKLFENPPGEMFLREDPMRRWKKPKHRVWGFSVWAVPSNPMPGGREFPGSGHQHMSRHVFRYVVIGTVLTWVVLLLVLLTNLGVT
jgi:hypothetical protein